MFWVHASTQDRLQQAFRAIAQDLRLPGWENPQTDVLHIVVQWLNSDDSGPWLLVLDNADDIEMFFGPIPSASHTAGLSSSFIADLLPRNSNGSIIITTRDMRVGQRLTDREEPIDVKPFSLLDAEQLLRVRMTLEDDASSADVEKLLDTLGFIPLAITQAAAFIKENKMTIAAYNRDLIICD